MTAATRSARLVAFLAPVVVAGTALAGCGVSTGEDTYSPIPPDEILFGLDATSTSTTTSTTTTTTIADPPETVPTTTTSVRLDAFDLYFLSRGRLQPVETLLPAGFSADQVADKLEEGPPPGAALDSLIEDGLIVAMSEEGGVLTVDLDAETFDRIPSTQQTEAVAQIVLTMINSLNRVGQVRFTVDGEPIPVKKGNSLLSEVGEPLPFDAYAVLLVRTAPVATTTTTTPAPDPTTVTTPP